MEVLQRLWELLFSLPWLDDLAYYLHSLPLYPLFTSVHFFLTALALRNEPGTHNRHLLRVRAFIPLSI